MVSIHQPTILALLETRIIDHKRLDDELGFPCFIQSSAIGHFEGIVILWKDDSIFINEVSVSTKATAVTVKVSSHPSCWIFSVIYASTDLPLKKILWDQLISIAYTIYTLYSNCWLVGTTLMRF